MWMYTKSPVGGQRLSIPTAGIARTLTETYRFIFKIPLGPPLQKGKSRPLFSHRQVDLAGEGIAGEFYNLSGFFTGSGSLDLTITKISGIICNSYG